MFLRLFLATTVFALYSQLASSETIRVGAWNIQDLHHKEDFSLRRFGTISSVGRTSEDFDLLVKYRDQFGSDGSPADVIALQEIGTEAALEKIFPSSLYQTIMSPRWNNDDAVEGEGEVYTAIAVRRDSGISVVQPDPLPGLAVLHSDGRPTRAGTGALLEFGGQQFWFLSVHLKSSCATTKNAHTSTDDDCETLWQQIPILVNWIEEKRTTGIPFIVGGDFNRRFRQFSDTGPVWKALNGIAPNEEITTPWLLKHPETVTRKCPTRKGDSTQPIDWILLSASLTNDFVENSFWERRFSNDDVNAAQGGKGLSDHCPISIDLDLNG
ncbi:endonuclease/exonuclease/phosphatase family protein [Roseibium sp.]|uniref:endonuclease/exonuclease/phosphatase family protein n=1 Tax=Roseibium sp. TaxID=1936156 RepID=UPI003B510067